VLAKLLGVGVLLLGPSNQSARSYAPVEAGTELIAPTAQQSLRLLRVCVSGHVVTNLLTAE